jgi:hypothetical protein
MKGGTMEGLWIVQYMGLHGDGGGVAVFMNGKVLGGDSGYTYIGTYTVQDDVLESQIRVKNFLPEVPNVLGIIGDFDLELTGAGIAVRLEKVSDL